MDGFDQTYINAAIGLVGAALGWMLRIIWAEIKELQREDGRIEEKVARLEVFVAGAYPTREELRHEFAEINSMLQT